MVHACADSEGGTDAVKEVHGDDYHLRLDSGFRADWDGHTIFGSTLHLQKLWGDSSQDDEAKIGLAELYLDIRNIGFLPLSLKAGRQRLSQGRGLLLSDEEREWHFDGIDLTYGTFPSSLRMLAARRAHISPDTPIEWVGLLSYKYAPRTVYMRECEVYGGAVFFDNSGYLFPFGARFEMLLSPQVEAWSELILQTGENPARETVNALLADIGAEYSPSWLPLQPKLLARATYASGGSDGERRDFVPMMDEGVGGVVLRPRLSNIQVYESRIGFNPSEAVKLECSFFRYLRNSARHGSAGKSGWLHEGFTVPASAENRDLGWEANLSLELQTGENLTFRLTAGLFSFGSAFDAVEESEAVEALLEMVWRY